MGLVLSRKPGQSIDVGDEMTVEVLAVRGNTVRLRLTGPVQIKFLRSELGSRRHLQGKPAEARAKAG